MDIQKIISDVMAKLEGNDNLIAKFTADPVKTLEGLLNVDLPDDKINAVVEAVKAKLNLDQAGKKASGILGAIKNIFKK
ncbi:MAG: hypothetical protein E7316_05120 [Clostridiales bacterium]|nr:hypothetical protein [Clostridiales bacterium]